MNPDKALQIVLFDLDLNTVTLSWNSVLDDFLGVKKFIIKFIYLRQDDKKSMENYPACKSNNKKRS